MIPLFHSAHWRQHIALDVGTATIRIATGLSPLTEYPSLIGLKRALCNGVVVDGETVSNILEPLMDRVRRFGIFKPCVLACAPSDARQEERQLLIDSIINAGAASVMIIPEPLAAAIGAGLDVSSPYAQMVIDIGEGVTDCAIIRSSKIRTTCAIRIGCDQMRRAIVATAISYGSTIDDSYADMLMRTSGLLRSAEHVGSVFTKMALLPVIEKIAATIDSFLRDLPHDEGCEIIENGICLTGGGALIPGVRDYFEQRTGISTTIASNPRASVAEGARAIVPVILFLNLWR
ncbi:MAG: rod shape-determining protein [Geobacteraceae bacterium]|nr:rod shape-determining protein [Geobacteraceae bacterium]